MSIKDFSLIESIFNGGSLTSEKQEALFAELLFMVLTRATAADLNIETVEVERVIAIMKKFTGQTFDEQEIRLAALSRLYKLETFERYISRSSRKLSIEQRQSILCALIAVFKADGGIGALEADFFNLVANALNLTPAQMFNLAR